MRRSLAELKPSLIRQIHALKRPDSIDLSLGEPTLPIEPELWQRGLARYERSAKGYSPNLGLPELREAIQAHYGLAGREAIVTVGSEEALFLCFYTLLDTGDEVIIPDPAYPAYAGLATMVGARAVRVAGSTLSAERVAAAVTERTKLVVVSGPSNPLGQVDVAGELQALAALAERHGFHVVSDEIYAELYFDAAPPPSIRGLTDRAMVVSGLSKSCAMTGHRLGWLLAPAGVAAAMWPVHQLTVTCAPALAQHLALEAFAEPRFLSAHRPIYAARWLAAKAALDACALPYIEPRGGFFVMCPIVPGAGGQRDDAFAWCLRLLEQHNVVTVPGTAFGPGGAPFVRLSFAGAPEAFATAARAVQTFLAGG